MAKEKKERKNKKADKTADISKSKAKRAERKKAAAKQKHRQLAAKIAGIVVVVAIVAVIVVAVGEKVYLAIIRTTSSSDMSAGLSADGKIDGVNVMDCLTLADYANISVPADEVAATAEEVDADISSTLESYTAVSDDPTLVVADGDVVNIDYVGSIDGVEFEGGNSNGTGYDLTIGSGTFIDDFEEQLIGHSPGENVTVEATFPDNYSNEELAGKDAVFAVTINGINVTPELTDEFVAENFAEEGFTTAAEYRAFVENNYYEDHLEDYLTTYVMENSEVKSYPSSYVKTIKAITKYDDEYMLEYYNQMFSYYGMDTYENVWDTRGEEITDELSYEKELKERARETVKTAMVYQAIFEDAGLTIDMDAVLTEMTEENGDDYVASMKETYGEGYMAQAEIKDTVIEYLMELYK